MGRGRWWGEGHVETIHAPRCPVVSNNRLTVKPAALGRKTEQNWAMYGACDGEWCVSSQQINPAAISAEGACEEKQKQARRARSSHRFCGEKVVSKAGRQRMFLYTHPPLPLQRPEEPALGKYPQQCHLFLFFSSHGLGTSRQWWLSPRLGWATWGASVSSYSAKELIPLLDSKAADVGQKDGSSWRSRKGPAACWPCNTSQASTPHLASAFLLLHDSTTFLQPKYNGRSPPHWQRDGLVFFIKSGPHLPEHILACLTIGATQRLSLGLCLCPSLSYLLPPDSWLLLLTQGMRLNAESVREVVLLPFSALMPLEEAVF